LTVLMGNQTIVLCIDLAHWVICHQVTINYALQEKSYSLFILD